MILSENEFESRRTYVERSGTGKHRYGPPIETDLMRPHSASIEASEGQPSEPSILASFGDEERQTAGEAESFLSTSRRRRSEDTGATAPRTADNIA
ncbi:hypothetical protein ALC56_09276 [Trachymyrmex septentrionalis]|uniref:Uncharacterized protein n=1 Tax=Trachymyrmex septentrionalis TaxID=34720 RepID=A0A195F7F5_9HYME|nr:hypothetical protein ALC56_09276 [Trachymyrmex septentrionalis]